MSVEEIPIKDAVQTQKYNFSCDDVIDECIPYPLPGSDCGWYRLCIVGKSGSGKTNLLRFLTEKGGKNKVYAKKFYNVYYISPSVKTMDGKPKLPEENFYESKEMHDLLVSFYKFGFVIIKNIPTTKNYIVEFANSIGSVRRTNFGEYFDVKSKPDPNDLAYTSLALAPHTDNPYRNPVPCIQLLHCIESKVSGGYSTLVDGYTVTEDLKKSYPDYYKILTEIKVRFKFIDKEVILESLCPLIELDEHKNFKQVRFSPRLDFVPILDKEELDLYYQARKKLSEMYNSDKYRIEFKLAPKDLMMMDNHRLLHGRTVYDANEGERFLQGCYIDYDSTEGKLRHLKRKFNL